MSKTVKLTPRILKKIIKEEREKINQQKDRIKNAKSKRRLRELRREVKALMQLKREHKLLLSRIRKINDRTNVIKKKIKES
jgi:predicted  nucleic acid-binding Zn-ribbon protein